MSNSIKLQPEAYSYTGIEVNKRVIGARFSGVAIIGKLNGFSLSSLVLQEAAFGSNNDFPTLEQMVRNEGYSYRIVQSLLAIGKQPFIYWGIQCEPKDRGKFKVLVGVKENIKK